MIPAGYMAKRICRRPDWLKAERVNDIYSVSSCVSSDFADYINFWKHNGYWLFDCPEAILDLAIERNLDLEGTLLFYYEIYEFEFDQDHHSWTSVSAEPAFGIDVTQPLEKQLEGYDVVTFWVRSSPECSPLSCNSFASEVETNEHCLLSSLEEAKQLLEAGKFKDGEPGPYRIFAVYSVDWPTKQLPAHASRRAGL